MNWLSDQVNQLALLGAAAILILTVGVAAKYFKQIKEGKSDLRVLYSNLVTAHTRSQRLLVAYKFIPTALKLSVHDQAEFVGLDTQEVGRESLLYAITAPLGFEATKLYVPATQAADKIYELVEEFIGEGD